MSRWNGASRGPVCVLNFKLNSELLDGVVVVPNNDGQRVTPAPSDPLPPHMEVDLIKEVVSVDASVNYNVLDSSTNDSSLVSSAVDSDTDCVSQPFVDKMVVQSPKGGSEVDSAEFPITGGYGACPT